MLVHQLMIAAAVTLESFGKVLFNVFLGGVGLAGFILVGFGLSAAVFLAWARFRLPRSGRRSLLVLNLSTAVSFGCFFFALQHAAPAVVASLEVGTSIVAAVILVWTHQRSSLSPLRILACLGIVGGTLLLCAVEIGKLPAEAGPTMLILACVAGAVSGATSTFSAQSSKDLSQAGWSPTQVLAHRFHLTLLFAGAWLGLGNADVALPSASALPAIALVAAVAVIAPLLLFQLALRRCDTLSVMVCCAVQPLLSFLVAIPSPSFIWNQMTLVGVMAVTAFLMLDVAAQRGMAGSRRSEPAYARAELSAASGA
ncbi:MAG: hypothetical protein J0H67_04955 [Rhodospirillales bacterium]|nr:hypothetical protein [Rhodospirillales bacterium]